MAEIFTPVTTTNLTNQTSITQAIDQNFTALSNALLDVVARSGTSPNSMNSVLDMNSNQIINLPAPATLNSPMRVQDVASATSVSTSILSGNNIFTGTNSFTGTTNLATTNVTGSLGIVGNMSLSGTANFAGTNNFSGTTNFTGTNNFTGSGTLDVSGPAYFGNGYPWADVRAYGAKGDDVTNDSSSIQAAINAVSALGGGTVYIPPGSYYISATSLNVPAAVWLIGASQLGCSIHTGTADANIINFRGSYNGCEKLFLVGNLSNSSSTGSCIWLSSTSVGTVVRDVVAWGGANGISSNGDDCYFENVFPAGYFACIASSGANWYHRVKMDTIGTITQQYAFFHGAPSGSVTVSENHFELCDFSGPWTSGYAIAIDDGSSTPQSIMTWEGCVLPSMNLVRGQACMFTGCEMPPSGSVSIGITTSVVGSFCPSGSTVYPSASSVVLAGNINIT